MMEDVECPYCGKWQEICNDDGHGCEEDELYEEECSYCEKTFTFTTCISFDYYAEKADCLNGGAHDLEKARIYPNFYPDHVRCKNCNHI